MNIHQKTPDQLSKVFLALAHPIRRTIISTLITGDVSVTKLAEPYEISLVALSKHLRILENAGLIKTTKDKQLRLSHLQTEPLKEAFFWIEHYKQFWEEGFDKLEKLIEKEKNKKEL